MLLQKIISGDTRSSLSEMHRLQQQLNRLFSLGLISDDSHEFPAINIWTSEQGAIVRTEIPGVNPEEVDISIVNDTLTIKGERCPETKEPEGLCHRQERGFGYFARSVKLPFAVDLDNIKADFSGGILQIRFSKAAADKLRKISVRCE